MHKTDVVIRVFTYCRIRPRGSRGCRFGGKNVSKQVITTAVSLNEKHQRTYLHESQGSWFNISACVHHVNMARKQNRKIKTVQPGPNTH